MESTLRNMVIAMCIIMLFSSPAWCAGLWVLEMANPDIGAASAGRGATAADASVAMFNPAGMTKLDRSQLFTSIQGSWLNVEFDVDESTVTVRSSTTSSFIQDRNFKDTWHAAGGARYRFAAPWLWSVGFAYDSSPVNDRIAPWICRWTVRSDWEPVCNMTGTRM